MSINNREELTNYCLGGQLINNFSFYPKGMAEKILKHYNLDKYNRPSRIADFV